MKLMKATVAVLLLALITMSTTAQRIRLIEGNLSALKNEKDLNTEFTYENMKVGKYDKEEDYVAKRRKNIIKKKLVRVMPGHKTGLMTGMPALNQNSMNCFRKPVISPPARKRMPNTPLIFKTTFTEPGFNIAVMRRNAELNGEAWIVETANKGNVIAKISVDKALGRTYGGYDFDTGGRIAEAYADAGKALGRFVKNNF